ncbi:LysR family transcriptional regulator [Oceanospirillum sediminis]|uniref:LysR family transcriptional regulator n=1 Tax=Oceanospirillum sediminis TaxID=2760088 RepID=A0A839IT08_9GAMM|nr:LysR family transcriptional regulator [Oceanospirillum sediminis]MBB1487742.1 LysR family transcriptional regulator [Oceanospirillum sediminis]
MHNMNWDDLRILLAVSNTGSQSAAADHLGINQTTISRRLRQLEQNYGQPLLQRQRKGYVFTDEANLLIEQARKMEAHMLEIARAQANDRRSELKGQVVVSSTDMVLRYMIAPVLSEFRQRYPGIELVLLSNDEVVSLSHMEADIALRYIRSEQLDIVQRKLITFQYSYFASPDYLDKYPVDESVPLQGHRILKFEHIKYRYNSQQLQDFDNNEIIMRSNHADLLIDACRQGLGIISLQQQYGMQISGLRMLNIPPHRNVSVWIASHKDNRRLPAIHAVKEFIIEASERCARGEFAVEDKQRDLIATGWAEYKVE